MLTEDLRAHAGAEWTSIVTDGFTDELAAGTLDRDRLKRYLSQDHLFLDAFVVLLASMIAVAPSLEDRIPGAQFLALITGKENTYFQRAFQELGRTQGIEPATTKFITLMQQAARSNKLHVMLAVLVVAEWSYLEWAERVTPVDGLHWLFQEWIDLHTGDYFNSVVDYLKGLLDSLSLDEGQKKETKDAFLAAVRCEQAFWNTFT